MVQKLKKKDPLPEGYSHEGRIVIISGFPENAETNCTIEKIQSLFPGENKKLESVRVGRDKKKKFTNTVEVEFETADIANQVLKETPKVTWPDTNSELTLSVKKLHEKKNKDEKKKLSKKTKLTKKKELKRNKKEKKKNKMMKRRKVIQIRML